MSFYRNQDKARRNTGLLLFYLLIAITLIILTIDIVTYFLLLTASYQPMTLETWLLSKHSAAIAGLTLLVIIGGSLVQLAKLSRGGIAVATMAGATPVDSNSADGKERQLLNITEEMAIASGTPVPRVFLMRGESAINAFVAGTTIENTILAVTQGALDKLTRDELQGVIGHEFSHILNGDMKLNIRLMGVLAGILLIGKFGEFLIRGNRHRSYSRSTSNKRGNQAALLGLALMAIGYIGLFFGRLIKSAISRQREFLADASSVQFTRNPDGIAGALYAIDHYDGHAYLLSAHAEDVSHLCFGESVKIRWGGLLNSHPPITDRIKAIEPTLLPRLKARFRNRLPRSEYNSTKTTQSLGIDTQGFTTSLNQTPITPDVVKQSIGQPTPEHFQYAQQLHGNLPSSVALWIHDRSKAEHVLYALLKLLPKQDLQADQSDPVFAAIAALPQASRLPILDITIATLKAESPQKRQQIINHCEALIQQDSRIQLSELIYYFLIQKGLAIHNKPRRTIRSLQQVDSAVALLLSVLARHSSSDKQQQCRYFQQVMNYFTNKNYAELMTNPPSAKAMNAALEELQRLNPLLKQPVINACIDLILKDQQTNLKEIEILRAVCEALDCPMPPLLLSTQT